jgi:RNA-directed DNA polymerase
MLFIRPVKHLAAMLQTTTEHLIEVAESTESFCDELELFDPAKPNKVRDVLNVRGDLRRFQDRLLRRVLLPKLSPSPYSHGGVKGRHIKTNIAPHIDSVFVFTADISDFFPSVSYRRVYRLFSQQLGCSPDVARLCTKICTYRHHLALGLITSPAIAEQVLLSVDRRVAGACKAAGLVYTRYVDDLCISGRFDLGQSRFAILIKTILAEHGFKMNPAKNSFGRLADGTPITKIVVKNGHPDVRREYLV